MTKRHSNANNNGDRAEPPEQLQPMLVPDVKVADLLGISVRSVWRLNSAHRIPEPVRLAGNVRWSVAEIQKWVDAGCPPLNNQGHHDTK